MINFYDRAFYNKKRAHFFLKSCLFTYFIYFGTFKQAITESVKVQIAMLIGVFMSVSLFAQDDVSQFFDDEGISTPDNAFKIDFFATAGGDLTFLYERFFTDEFSVELGVGFGLAKGIEPIFLSLDTEEFFTQRGGGFKIIVNPRFHPWGDRREDFVYGINFFFRELTDVQYANNKIDRTDLFIGLYQGYLWEVGNRMSLELGYRVGFMSVKGDIDFSYLRDALFNFGCSFKLAYHK